MVPTVAVEVWIAIIEAVPSVVDDPMLLDGYTPVIRQVYAMSVLDAEVGNGGFSQFLFNGGGAWLDDAIAGLQAIGLDEHRQVTVEVADAGVAQIDALRAARREGRLESYAAWARSSDLGQFDDRWYALDGIGEVLDAFVARQEAEIWEPAG